MPEGGWIPLWRKSFKGKFSPSKEGRPYTNLEAWLYLCCSAVQNPNGADVIKPGYSVYHLGPGEILTTFRGLALEWGWGSHNKVRRFVQSLHKLQSVTIMDRNPLHLKINNAELYGLVRTNGGPKNGPTTDHARTNDGPVQQEEQDKQEEQITSGGLIQAWEIDIMGEAGLPTGAIPAMSSADRNKPDGRGWKELDETIRWAEAEYGGADAVRARLVELAKQHKAGKLRLFSLKATLNSPDLMRPKPAMETMEEYRARLANLPD